MGKRKRHSNDHSNDVGIGETLMHLRNSEPTLPNNNPEAAVDDNDGWTIVGKGGRPPKKKKKHKDERNYPAIDHSHHARLQSHVKITDLQSLVLYILADGFAPQWVSVRHRTSIRQVVALMVPGLELAMFNGKIALPSESLENSLDTDKLDVQQNRPKRLHVSPDDYYPASLRPERLPAALKPLSDIFPHVWPIRTPSDYKGDQYYRVHSAVHTMLTSPIPKTEEEKRLKKDPRHKGPIPQGTKNWENKCTPITEYIADLMEQHRNEYVVHPAWHATAEDKEIAYQRRKEAKQTSEDGWVDTDVAYLEDGNVSDQDVEKGSVTAGRHVLVMDCEMCKSEDDVLVLTRISLLGWDGEVILDQLVKPDVPIKNYLTQFSGITEAMLENVTTTLSDVQKQLLDLITPHTILVGHSLNSDLNALKLTHPFVVDTGILYPHARGPPYKQSLKWLAQKYLSREIQKGAQGHNSVEDARACLDLLKQKCERGPRWGTGDANAESIFKRLGRATRPNRAKSSSARELYRTGAVVDWGEPIRGHGGQARVCIGCQSDVDIVEGIERAVTGRAVGKDGAAENVDFVWGRLRELELIRGWWDHGKTVDNDDMRKKALQRLGQSSSEDVEDDKREITGSELGDAVAKTVGHIVNVFNSLPPCTAFIVYSGTGDPREVRRLQAMRQQYQREYATKNWDNLSVKWTDTEVQALSRACRNAREGVGFVVVK